MVKKHDDTVSRFYLIPERYGRTDRRDGRTDRQICYINIARQYADARILTRDKNDSLLVVMQSRIRILNHLSTSLTTAEQDILGQFSVSHDIAILSSVCP